MTYVGAVRAALAGAGDPADRLSWLSRREALKHLD